MTCSDNGRISRFDATILENRLGSLTPYCIDETGKEKKMHGYGELKGPIVSLSCGKQALPSGVVGSTGWFVESLRLLCSSATSSGTAPDSEQAGPKNPVGFTLRCPEGKALRGIFGAYGIRLDSIGLICEK